MPKWTTTITITIANTITITITIIITITITITITCVSKVFSANTWGSIQKVGCKPTQMPGLGWQQLSHMYTKEKDFLTVNLRKRRSLDDDTGMWLELNPPWYLLSLVQKIFLPTVLIILLILFVLALVKRTRNKCSGGHEMKATWIIYSYCPDREMNYYRYNFKGLMLTWRLILV